LLYDNSYHHYAQTFNLNVDNKLFHKYLLIKSTSYEIFIFCFLVLRIIKQ
jgi:hypothetical protein